MAASATFALNAGLCVRRARLAIVTPDLRHSRRLQAETPLTDLSEFGQPALSPVVHGRRKLAIPRRPSWGLSLADVLGTCGPAPPLRHQPRCSCTGGAG